MTTTTKLSLKGSTFCGEAYPQAVECNLIGGIYKLADGSFALVKRQEYSGNILSVEATDPKSWRKFRTLDLGYSRVQMYAPRLASDTPKVVDEEVIINQIKGWGRGTKYPNYVPKTATI